MNTYPKTKRKVEIVVISDVHLGTYGCRAKELVAYMKSIQPETVILNGDIIDVWQFDKKYFPKSHMQVIHQITKWLKKGVTVYYLTGNHDEMLRRFAGFRLSNFMIENKLVLNLPEGKTWIFHGDVFDITMQHARWLARLGSVGYNWLIHLNTFCNFISEQTGRGRISLSKKIKNNVKQAVSYINSFENTCAALAAKNHYRYVVCGHIHHPEIKTIATDKGPVIYLNSGDWIENLSALEYHEGIWKIYRHTEQPPAGDEVQEQEEDKFILLKNEEIFRHMLSDFRELTPFVKQSKNN
ncbi:MAG: UDP-2,3-diacylglucosamine diphosphatase [Bacteroidia bacterium]|nr:UDP-2,3-diacylglucosamine diphosphatase [Bacteroidia bacterium]